MFSIFQQGFVQFSRHDYSFPLVGTVKAPNLDIQPFTRQLAYKTSSTCIVYIKDCVKCKGELENWETFFRHIIEIEIEFQFHFLEKWGKTFYIVIVTHNNKTNKKYSKSFIIFQLSVT